MKYIFTALVLPFFLFCGCSLQNVRETLNDVESYIMERPDSALTVLDSIDRSILTTEHLRAHHALLHAMALDKNYIDVSDDSIARVAVDYYIKKAPCKHQARALYYLGVAYYYQGEYDKAILEFTKAEDVAEKCDSLYLGMAKAMQAETYDMTHNSIERLKCLEEAYEIYKSINDEYHMRVTELSLSLTLFNMKKYEEAEEILKILIADEGLKDDMKESVTQTYAFTNVVKDSADFIAADRLYSRAMSEYGGSLMAYKDYWVWAYSLNELGRKSEAQDIIDQLMPVDTSGTAYYWLYAIEKSNGNLQAALEYLEVATEKLDKETSEALEQSLASSQRDFYESKFEIAEYEAYNRKLIIISVVVFSALCIGLILWILSRYMRVKNEEKEYYLRYADEISRQLEAAKNQDYPELKKKYLDLYKSQFEMLGSLYEQYALYQGKSNAEHAVYEKVSAIIDDFKSDCDNMIRLESMLNENMDNIVAKFKAEIPRLKETDYSIFCFILIGFDVTTISHILNTTMNVIYIRKSRMRQKIEQIAPEHRDKFLEILG